MTNMALPEPFQDLLPYIGWALSTERERRARRIASSMDEILAFHGAMLARLEEIIHYLNQYPYQDLPEDAVSLCNMGLSHVEISNLVEMYKSPDVMNVMDPERFLPYE